MAAQAANDDVYFGWGLQAEPVAGRGKSETVRIIPGFMFDVDLRSSESGVHSKNELLPNTWEEVLAFVRRLGLPEPTAIRHSGNGAYFDWLFETPLQITNENRAIVVDLSKRLQRVIIESAKKSKGWHFDNVGDLARVSRLPGTLNHKTKPPKSVQLLSCNDTRRYSSNAIQKFVENIEKGLDLCKSENSKPIDLFRIGNEKRSPDERQEYDGNSFEPVAIGCRWVEWVLENARQLPEPDWYALASIVGRCEDGDNLYHAISKQDSRYDPEQTASKLKQGLEVAGPRSCENIANGLGFAGCKQCPFSKQIKGPWNLSTLPSKIVGLMRNHVLDIATGRYIDLATRKPLDEKAFVNKFWHLVEKKGTPHSILVKNDYTRKVDRCDYLPGNKSLFTSNESSEDVLNLWEPSSIQPLEGDASILLEHLNFIYPDEDEQNHFLNCMAHAVQKPEEKIRHVLLTIGTQGTGKSFLVEVLKPIFGSRNIFTAESTDLYSDWTAAMGNRQLLIMEELGVFERRETYEKLKRWVTDETVTVNEKHVKKYRARTPKLIVGFSNHATPIAMQEGDRRWWVSLSPAKPKKPEYYRRLFSEGLKQVPAFLYRLLHRDISKFDASEPPPATAAKQMIISMSLPTIEQEISSMMDEQAYPFTGELFRMQDLRDELTVRFRGRAPSVVEVTRTLKKLGVVKLTQTRLDNEERPRLWAWTKQDKWQQALPDDIRKEMRPQLH